MNRNIKDIWTAPQIDLNNIKTGDMPGDKIAIDESHIKRANQIFPYAFDEFSKTKKDKYIISVYGGSGVGKSEIGSILGFYFSMEGYESYVLSGDNYVKRIPSENDKERYQKYLSGGRPALEKYLGTDAEVDFFRINKISNEFKNKSEQITLKKMGRNPGEIENEKIDFSDIKILIIEWTHGNNPRLNGIDYPIFLYSTPEQTIAHRRQRARDKNVDSPFVQLVLEIEQEKLLNQAVNSSLIVSNSCEILTYKDFLELRECQK